jgi:hypothetical protein
MMEGQALSEKKVVWQQALALCFIVLPSIVLYITVTARLHWATWLLLALIAIGNLVAIWVS